MNDSWYDINAFKNSTPISDNATNGDVIKAMFPKREVIEHDTYIEVAWGEGMDEFDKNWWNAPYQKGGA